MRPRILAYPLTAVLAVGLTAVVATPAQAAATVRVDPATTHQVIDGFGGSGAFRVASTMHGSTGLSPAKQRELLDVLFDPTRGAGLSILRNEIGSSTTACTGGPDDGDTVCSIEPDDPGGPGARPRYVWDGSDADQVWLSREARARGVRYIEADAWSPPAYMKTNRSLKNGGYLCGLPGAPACASGDWRQHYADYLVRYLRFYRAAGVDIDFLAYANEPDLAPGYTGANWDASTAAEGRGVIDPTARQHRNFINNYLGPTLARARPQLGTRIACCEATSWDRAETYADALLADPTTRRHLGLVTGHGYWSDPPGWIGPEPIESAAAAGKHTWQTEVSDFTAYNPTWAGGDITRSGYQWALNLHEALVGANVNGYLYWTLSWQNSPATADNGNLTLIDGPKDTFYVPKRLWAFAGYSRYVRPGAVRVGATSSNSALKTSAFRNRDGSYVVVVINTQDTPATARYATPGRTVLPYLTNETHSMAQQRTVRASHGAFTATVPAKSMMTFRVVR